MAYSDRYTVPTNTLPPALRRLIGTRKRNVSLEVLNPDPGTGPTYTRRSSAWDGGSRDFYGLYQGLAPAAWDPGTGPGGFPNFFPSDTPHVLRPGQWVLNTGTFRGKPATACLIGTRESLTALGIEVPA